VQICPTVFYEMLLVIKESGNLLGYGDSHVKHEVELQVAHPAIEVLKWSLYPFSLSEQDRHVHSGSEVLLSLPSVVQIVMFANVLFIIPYDGGHTETHLSSSVESGFVLI